MTPNTPMTELPVDDLETAVRAFMPLAQVAFLWTHEASPPEGEIQRYRDAYHNVLRALRQSDTRIEGGGEAVAPHTAFRQRAFRLAIGTDPSRYAGDLDDVDDNTEEGLGRTLAIVSGAYDWTIDDKGRLFGLVGGDHGYASTGIIVDAPLNKSPTPQHVEGDVLSVGEMEVVAWECTDLILGGEPSVITDVDHAAMRKIQPKAWTVEDLVRASSVQSRIQRAERERDEAIDRAKVWEHYWQQEVKVKGEVISWCKDYQTRIAALEAQLADAVKAVKEAAKGLDMVHNGLMDPTRPRQAVGEVCAHFLTATNAFLSTIGEKPDAE